MRLCFLMNAEIPRCLWLPQAEKHRGIEPAAQLLGKLGNFALSCLVTAG